MNWVYCRWKRLKFKAFSSRLSAVSPVAKASALQDPRRPGVDGFDWRRTSKDEPIPTADR